MKVHLDPGHGGKDPGAIGNNLQEKNINLSVALKIGKILERHNVEVEYTRMTDIFVDLTPRTIKANKWGADIFVSIHCNSFGVATAQGVETFHYTNSVKGKILATDVQNSLIDSKVYTKNRGVKQANFTVIAKTTMPAILVELAFISNTQDANILKNKQDELAIAVAKGILKNLGIKYQDTNNIVKINILGQDIKANGYFKNGTNYIKIGNRDVTVRELAKALNLDDIRWDNNKKVVYLK